MLLKKTKLMLPLFAALSLMGCKKWDNHTAVKEQDLSINLLQAIAANDSLTTFRQYVQKTGLDTLLQNSKTYTVWAPTNGALLNMDPSVVADTAQLKKFVLNHIAPQSYFTKDAWAGVRVGMLSGKYQNFTTAFIENATIVKRDQYVRNGVLHQVNNFMNVLPSIWEFVNSTATQYDQNAYIRGLNFNDFDPSLAIIDSISPTTGQPIYQPGTGIVVRNRFNERVQNLRAEDKQYTYFVIANPGFTTEVDSLKNYYKAATPAITDSLSRWNTVKDLIVEGLYLPNNLPSVLTSKFGTPLYINPANITGSQRMSNGIVYFVTRLDAITADKFKTITIQGEQPSGFLSDRRSNTNYRDRRNPVTGALFSDLLVLGHGVTSYYAFYRLNETPSIKYKVYALGVNDFQTGTFTQNIVPKYLSAPNTYTTLATLPHAVPLSTAPAPATPYSEVYLGEFTMTNYGTLELQLTASGTNPIVLDYVRLVPVP